MKAIVTVGIGFGDEGKGQTVDHLVRKHKAKLVVRYSGGCQSGHNVELPSGHRHCFSQFGAGTFAGAATYLAQPVIIDAPAIRNEARALEKAGVADPLSRLVIHPRCLVSTPFHKAVNIADVENLKHGTCGMGIGVARKYWIDHGADAIFAEDLKCHLRLQEKLALFVERLPALQKIRPGIVEMAARLVNSAEPLRLDDGGLIPGMDEGTVIFEGAQGLLLDQAIGCHPHTTWSDVTPRVAIDLAKSWGVESIETLGVVRPYMTRHGNGPLPTECRLSSPTHSPIVDPGNPEHAYQGKMRFGYLDMPLLGHATAYVNLHGLAVNCLDHIRGNDSLRVAMRRPPEWLWHSESWDLSDSDFTTTARLSPEGLLDVLGTIAPVRITADGPTWEHRKELNPAT